MTQVTVLILGGTTEARELAGRLATRPGLRVVTSLAGRTRGPAPLAGEVRTGGFGGARGLAQWLDAHRAAAVIDASHPFAQAISTNAAAACAESGTPLFSLGRPPHTAGPGDDWHEVSSLQAAAERLPSLGRRAFLTTGRQGLAAFAALHQMWFLIRCASPPPGPLPAARQVILARGPYRADREHLLMKQQRIDVLVTKNSGGAQTAGKLTAARHLGLPVIMISRPASEVPDYLSPAAAERWLLAVVAERLYPGSSGRMKVRW
jgi:precorrin-6A/cobalt-precorrin-6A reductase